MSTPSPYNGTPTPGQPGNPISSVPYGPTPPAAGLSLCPHCLGHLVPGSVVALANTDDTALRPAAWGRNVLGASLGFAAVLGIESALVAVLMLVGKLPSKDALWIAVSVTGVALAAYSFINGLRATPMLRRLFNIPTPN